MQLLQNRAHVPFASSLRLSIKMESSNYASHGPPELPEKTTKKAPSVNSLEIGEVTVVVSACSFMPVKSCGACI